MSFYPVQLNQVLAKINHATRVEVEETDPGYVQRKDGDAEWFLLESKDLERHWDAIVGISDKDFALIHCQNDPHGGVWLHYLPTNEYAPGCHQIPGW